MNGRYDAVVLGAGPAGSVTAAHLANAGLDVAVIDRSAPRPALRGEMLPPRILLPLSRLGLWDRFVTAGHRPCHQVTSSWGGSAQDHQDFLFDPYGCGWHVDREPFEHLLRGAAVESGAVLMRPAILLSAERAHLWHLVVRHDGERSGLTARFVVDATGRSARFARSAGAAARRHDRLVAVSTVASFTDPAVALSGPIIESVASGWLCTMPAPDSRAIVTHLTDADLADTRPDWRGVLASSTWTRARIDAGTIEPGGCCVAANSSTLSRVTGAGWLAVGDAAAAHDPLWGQGVLAALHAGELAAQTVVARLNGDQDATARYESAVARNHRDYRRTLAAYYRAERRWPAAPFWSRRFVAVTA